MSRPTEWDVLIVGAGPGGAAAAGALAAGGASTLLIDRARFPRSKVCGACLSPGALVTLGRLGLRDAVVEAGALPLSELVLCAGGRRAAVRLRGSASLSRARMDEMLVRAAVGHGAIFRDGVSARLDRGEGQPRVRLREGGREWITTARVVVDASGLGGGFEAGPRRRTGEAGGIGRPDDGTRPRRVGIDSRVGLGVALEDATYPLGEGELRMAIGTAGYVGLVRLEDGRLNLGAAVDPGMLGPARPGEVVARILRQAGVPSPEGASEAPWRGTPPLTQEPTAATCQRVLRVGDASGYVEPFTGEGIAWALDEGLAAAEVADAALRDPRIDAAATWRRRQRASAARAQRLCRTLARGLRRPRLVGAVVALLGRAPILAAPAVRVASRRPSAPTPVAG